MKNAYMVLRVFLSISVFLASLTTVRTQQHDCPGCSRCITEHRKINGTMSVLVSAFCQFKAGEKMTSVPQNLSSRLGTLRMTSHNVRELKTTSLRNYQYLYLLYLDKNGLQTIQPGAFSRQQFLHNLDLKENELVNITAETFRGLTSLKSLRLDHNKLQRISRGTFASVPSIETLDLRVNRISVLEDGAFDRLDHLETLLLSSNQLKAINSGDLGNLMSLTRLEVASNQIQRMDETVFDCAPLIKELVLKDNQLDSIPKESITSLRFLDILDISENPGVTFIESDALIGLQSLKKMDLNDCNISGIQNNAFDGLGKINTVKLKNNPLKCDCLLSWLPRWLSRKPDVSFDGAVCQAPRGIAGKDVLSTKSQLFVCTCADCTNDASCNQLPTNCSCSENWSGLSCNDTCQSYNESVNTCRKFGGNCFCASNATLQKTQKVSQCSFNITSEKCSEYGEIRKDGAHLECVCKEGFIGNGINCSDIDECQTGVHLCPLNAYCINTLGSHSCQCHEGYKDGIPGEAMACVDVDECMESKPCDVHAKCHNNQGSYTCTCDAGYTGNGKTCLPAPDKPSHLTVTEISPSVVTVSWSVSNSSIIRKFTVEYKGLGIHGSEWEVITLRPHNTQARLTDLQSDSTYLVRIGAFSIFNTSIYSNERIFKTPAATDQVPSGTDGAAGDPQNSVVIAVALVVSVALLALISCALYFLMKRRKKHKKKPNYPQYVPGLEDLIEMRTRSHSGGAESRGNRDLLELGSALHSFTSCAVDCYDEWEISRDLLVIGQKIGEGQFGLVLEGTLMTEDGPMTVAVKTIKEHADRFDIKDLLQEMEMMKEIGQHPHVVSLVGTCTTPGPLYIITEYVSGGNLLDYLRSSRPADETYVNVTSTLSSRDLLKIALDCARGMNHIANKKFVHRDLAARNILLTEDYEAKVADFGLARDIYGDGQYVKTGGGRLPIKWMAPESIQDQIYTTMSDVWSFGVLLWEIVTIGGAPYPCVPVNLLLTKLLCGYRMSKPAHCSEELYSLMQSCWHLEPEARPTFSEMCHILSEMLSESARSYVNVTVSDERVGPVDEDSDDTHEQNTSV